MSPSEITKNQLAPFKVYLEHDEKPLIFFTPKTSFKPPIFYLSVLIFGWSLFAIIQFISVSEFTFYYILIIDIGITMYNFIYFTEKVPVKNRAKNSKYLLTQDKIITKKATSYKIVPYSNIYQIGRYIYDNKVYGIDIFTKKPIEPSRGYSRSYRAILYDIPYENKMLENIIYLMRTTDK